MKAKQLHPAKKKAKELINMFFEHNKYNTNFKEEINLAKKRALIFIDEMLENLNYDLTNEIYPLFDIIELKEVKQELLKK